MRGIPTNTNIIANIINIVFVIFINTNNFKKIISFLNKFY
jgi:hypothetical protein